MMNADRGFLALLRDRQGSLLPIAAIAMVLTTALVGGGIDMSRAYRVQNRLQSACDSAVLAGRRAVTTSGYGDPEKNQAGNYFDTNFNDSSQETSGTNFTSSSFDNGKTIEGAATTQLNLAVMRIFGFQKFSLKVACSASMGVGNSDVMMVLDTTGSMSSGLGSSTRIEALRTAMKNFYTTVKTATTGSNSRIRYGFVPFSSSVNVGKLLMDQDAGYLVDSHTIQSRVQEKKWVNSSKTESEFKNDITGDWVPYGSSYTTESNCKSGLTNTAWAKNGSAQTLPPNTITSNDDQIVTTQTTVQPYKMTNRMCKQNSSDNKW
jgi:Flp pilus assembly protein TadG